MMLIRATLIAVGVAIGAYGAVLLWDNSTVTLIRIGIWAIAGVVLHDFVFAPLCIALGFAGRRLIPPRWWAATAVAALLVVTLGLLAIPVYRRPGAHADNLTVLDRDYPLGLWISIAVVALCLPLFHALNRLTRRHPHRQADDATPSPTTGGPPANGQ